jgi:hypothetical protein
VWSEGACEGACLSLFTKCVELEFSEVGLPLYGVLRSWLRGSAGGIMLVVEGISHGG